MTKSKRAWSGLFYDYHSRTFRIPNISRRDVGARRTEVVGSTISASAYRPDRKSERVKVYACGSANPQLTGDLKKRIQCSSLQFRFGCRMYDRSTYLDLFTYEVDHSYVVLMIRIPGSLGNPQLASNLYRIDLDPSGSDKSFITSNVTWIIHLVNPSNHAEYCLIWQ